MNKPAILLGILSVLLASSPEEPERPQEAIQSHVQTTAAGERILVEEVWLDAPVATVWAAYATADGWESWAAPKAEVDLRVGGTIRTQYDPAAAIGDPGTNTLRIVNYVPERLLTLKADLQPNWPELLKQDADNLSNVILFEEVAPGRTRLRSYGIGYRDTPEYDELLGFFQQANAGLYAKLIRHVEGGADGD